MDGKKLKDIRRANRLSQSALGALVGVHRVTVSAWETGNAELPVCVEIVARIIDEKPDLLVTIERWRGIRK